MPAKCGTQAVDEANASSNCALELRMAQEPHTHHHVVPDSTHCAQPTQPSIKRPRQRSREHCMICIYDLSCPQLGLSRPERRADLFHAGDGRCRLPSPLTQTGRGFQLFESGHRAVGRLRLHGHTVCSGRTACPARLAARRLSEKSLVWKSPSLRR